MMRLDFTALTGTTSNASHTMPLDHSKKITVQVLITRASRTARLVAQLSGDARRFAHSARLAPWSGRGSEVHAVTPASGVTQG